MVSRGHVPLYAIMSVHVVAVVVTSWLWPCRGVAVVPWRGRRDVAVASLGVAVARRGRGCGRDRGRRGRPSFGCDHGRGRGVLDVVP